jgi:hypothetical protein
VKVYLLTRNLNKGLSRVQLITRAASGCWMGSGATIPLSSRARGGHLSACPPNNRSRTAVVVPSPAMSGLPSPSEAFQHSADNRIMSDHAALGLAVVCQRGRA